MRSSASRPRSCSTSPTLAPEPSRGAIPLAAPALLAQLVEHFHGKEGVDGSSPSEGFGNRATVRFPHSGGTRGTTSPGHRKKSLVQCRRSALVIHAAARDVSRLRVGVIRSALLRRVPNGHHASHPAAAL